MCQQLKIARIGGGVDDGADERPRRSRDDAKSDSKKPRTPRPGANKKIDFKVSDKKRNAGKSNANKGKSKAAGKGGPAGKGKSPAGKKAGAKRK